MTTIDLNADLGEGYEFDVELMQLVSSCNIACGGHAGNAASMAATVELAIANEVAIGAHPSYPDRAGFGRRAAFCAGSELAKSLIKQIDTINTIARNSGATLHHIKPHGALYTDAASHAKLAEIVVAAALAVCPEAAVVGPPGGALATAAARFDSRYIAEGFVDRGYQSDGSLLPRNEPNAVLKDLNTVTTQALRFATCGEVTAANGETLSLAVQTLCLHGDTANAAELGRAVRDVLTASGVQIHAVA